MATQVQQALQAVPGAASVRSSNEDVQPQLRVTVDWKRAADLGVTVQNAGTALRTALDGWTSSSNQLHRAGQTAMDIRILSADAGTMKARDVGSLPILSTNGQIVQLNQFATISQVSTPTSIKRVNRLRAVTISAEPGQGRLVGDVQSAVQRAVRQIELPSGYTIAYGGQGSRGGEAFSQIFIALGVAILLMYLLMMVLFGSMVLPLAVLMSLPLSLVGLVGKNAILLVDYTEILISRGYDRTAALLEAGPTRLRPIIMTTLSVMVALVPIASGLEEGSELLQAAAAVLIGGLLTSTLLTLVFVPAMFTVFDDMQQAVRRLFRRDQSAEPAHASGVSQPERRLHPQAGLLAQTRRSSP